MKPERKLLITFDYELFLGKNSGTPENCMIRPTSTILECLRKQNIRAIFFVDSTYLLRLEEAALIHSEAAKDYHNILTQIRRMMADNHKVYLHLHPHWLDAVFLHTTNTWTLEDTHRFSFASLPKEVASKLFDDSIRILKEATANENNNNHLEGFRAGGLCIQPFTSFKESFIRNRIKYEFSLLPGTVLQKEHYGFNFSNSTSHSVYYFEDDILKEVKGQNNFREYPLSTLSMGFLIRVINSIWYRINKKLSTRTQMMGDGVSTAPKIRTTHSNEGSQKTKRNETLSVELMNPIKYFSYKQHLKNNEYIHFISHPKLFTASGIKAFERYLKHANKRYLIRTDFENWE